MIETELTIGILPVACDFPVPSKTKKADVAKHFEMFRHVGLLFNEPPGTAGLSFT